MDWTDWAVWVAFAALVAAAVLLVRLVRKNRRLRQMADEANRLRREADEATRRNRQLKQEMTSNIAHELKTPVSSIRGYLEILLSDKPVDDERRRHYLDRSYAQTLRLSDLISDVSLINKVEESADLFPKQAIDVRGVVCEAMEELSDRAASANIVLCNRLHEDMPIEGNHELLYCIFRNLIDNAISYAGKGREVVVETYTPVSATHTPLPSTHYFIHFYDNGQGVPDEYLSRIFDRFVRVGEGRSRTGGGTGLGLSIVKHAVQFHGGEIYAKNRTVGADSAADHSSGLEFFFSLRKQ